MNQTGTLTRCLFAGVALLAAAGCDVASQPGDGASASAAGEATGVPSPELTRRWLEAPPDAPADLQERMGADGSIVGGQAAEVLEAGRAWMGLPDDAFVPLIDLCADPRFASGMLKMFRDYTDGLMGPEVWKGQCTSRYPFCVAVGADRGSGFELAGSGIVIAPNAILTALHVVRDMESVGWRTFEVRYGANFNDPDDSRFVGLDRVIEHPGYLPVIGSTPSRDDIAVIILDEPVTWARGRLASRAQSEGERFIVVGYGISQEWETGRTVSGCRRFAPVASVANPCNDGVSTRYCCVSDYDLVAGGTSGPATGDACKGDSGGPLCADDESSSIVVAMTTHGKCPDGGCPSLVGVYLRLDRYCEWLTGLDEIGWAPGEQPACGP